MERFAIKIDKKLKANLYKICRLCGIDNPDMVPIISDKEANNAYAIDVDAEMELQQKINLLIGLSITKDDKMPQTMCCLCVDKINDFYEFREMCYATNAQTRKLLGLKNIKKTGWDIKPKVEVKNESIVPTSLTNKNGNRKRKSDEMALKDEATETLGTASKKKLRFITSTDSFVKEENLVGTKKKLRCSAMHAEPTAAAASSSKKSKNNAIDDIKFKNDHYPIIPIHVPPPVVNNKKLKLASLPQSTSKKYKQKYKNPEQKETDVKEEIKEEIYEELTSSSTAVKPALVPLVQKLKFACSICQERFPAKVNLETHTRTIHIPRIERFVCTACNEILNKSFDIKNHQLWHKLSKTPYVCGCCGESILNTYAFSRHLREHAFETPPGLLVLDRECPQCHTTYATNFLYNIHICAVKTKRCAGCNRLQRNEAEYLKHSAQCPKVYLSYSKHIMPSVEALEDAVRIKNENDVEAAAEEMARISGVPLDMAPVVQLTRLSSPLIMAASQCVSVAGIDDTASSSSTKKSGKKGVSKKDLKRVDELLKSTLDALVSIKHEPEVHVDQENSAAENSDNENHHDADASYLDDCFHNNDSDNESEELNPSTTMESGHDKITIKQEIDETCEENSHKICGGLKLKIKKEHGQLNSSIIEQQKSSEKRGEKRKKKKKHKDKDKDKQKLSKDIQDEQVSQDSNINNCNIEQNITTTTAIRIKAEPQETDEASDKSTVSPPQIRPQPEATIMTSIPMMQFQIACVSSGVEFNKGTNTVNDSHPTMPLTNTDRETVDVKPNREELDRMLKISHISSGIVMENDENEAQAMHHDGNNDKRNCDFDNANDYHEESNDEHDRADKESDLHDEDDNRFDQLSDGDKIINDFENTSEVIGIAKKIQKITMQPTHKLNSKPTDKTLTTVTKSRNKACKSTAKSPSMPAIQISAVQSGVTLEASAPNASDFIPVFIKPEPQNRGYSDEQSVGAGLETEPQLETQDEMEEQNYISSIDFNNITIKQEKDIEINDVQITQKSIKSFSEFNGIKRKRRQGVRSHCIKDKTLEQDNKSEDMAETEHYETDEEYDEESGDEEVEEEEEEEEDEEEEEGIEEEEEEREYRELEYPPQLIKNNVEPETEEQKPTSNANSSETEIKDHEATLKEETSHNNVAFVIANVCSQASTDISNVDISKSNDKIDHGQFVMNSGNNSSTSANVTDANDFHWKNYSTQDDSSTITAEQSLDNNNEKKLSCTTNTAESSYKSCASITTDENRPQTDLQLKVTSPNNQLEHNHTVPTHQGLQENVQTFNASSQLYQEKIQNSNENSTRLHMEEYTSLQDLNVSQESKGYVVQKSSQIMLQYSTTATQNDEVSLNTHGQVEGAQCNQSNALLENASNTKNVEVKPQASQDQPAITTVSSKLKNSRPLDRQELPKDNQGDTATIEGVIHQSKDMSLAAQPVVENINNEPVNEEADEELAENNINYDATTARNDIEVHQNDQNQEVLSQLRPTALALHPYLEDISSSSNSFLSNSLSQTPPPPPQPAASIANVVEYSTQRHVQQRLLNTEETENILNESNVVLSRRSIEVAVTPAPSIGQQLTQHNLGQQLPLNMPTFNFDNINEIAENNNNANIEREQLQDGQHQQN